MCIWHVVSSSSSSNSSGSSSSGGGGSSSSSSSSNSSSSGSSSSSSSSSGSGRRRRRRGSGGWDLEIKIKKTSSVRIRASFFETVVFPVRLFLFDRTIDFAVTLEYTVVDAKREEERKGQESLDADQTSQTPRILRLRRLPTRWKLVKPVSSLFSGSSTSIYYTSTCSRCSTLEEGERAKLEFSLRALLRRIDRYWTHLRGSVCISSTCTPSLRVSGRYLRRQRTPSWWYKEDDTPRRVLREYGSAMTRDDANARSQIERRLRDKVDDVCDQNLYLRSSRSRENKAVNGVSCLVTLARWNRIVHRISNFLTFNATYAGVIQHEKDFNYTILLGNLLGISTCLPTGDLRVTCTSSR
ncbi:hypothetical protein V1478_006659, partial [Vespula squamosa]